MLKGYYIHNQKKDGSGVSKKIDAQIKTFRKYADVSELILEAKKESWIQRKIRMKVLKARVSLNFDDTLRKIANPDFVYIRKQILDQDFLDFLKKIKIKFPECKVIMEVPTYPYWNEYPKNKLGEALIEEEKRIIPLLKDNIDIVISVGHQTNLFGIDTIQINNGIDVDAVKVSPKNNKTNEINLIAVAKFREEHGYERVIDSLVGYYGNDGARDVRLHLIGDGAEIREYKALSSQSIIKDKIFFHGFLTGNALDKVYEEADLGLGFFGLYKSGADYVSSLKSGEYFAKGLPIISAVEEDCMKGEGTDYTLLFPNDESKISMEKIIGFYDKIYSDDEVGSVHSKIRRYAEENLSYDVTMKPVIDYITK